MPLKAILFDLDGTLLPMDQDVFLKTYMSRIAGYMVPYGYEPKQLIRAIWTGSDAMVKNDGSRSNEDVFFDVLTELYGRDVRVDIPRFDAFYRTEFDSVRTVCGYNPQMDGMIKSLKRRGLRLILATNPVFPKIAALCRIGWAGLDPLDFEEITTYEAYHYCKPNLMYYREICQKAGLEPEQCLMVGNDVDDDMVVSALGMKVFLLTDCLINKDGRDIESYPHGSMSELLAYISRICR